MLKIVVALFLLLGLVALLSSYVGWILKVVVALAVSLVLLGLAETIVRSVRWKRNVRRSRKAFFSRYAGKRLYVVSSHRDWGNFVRNSLEPVLERDEELVWRRGNTAWWTGIGLPLSARFFCTFLGEKKSHTLRFPLLVRVELDDFSWQDLHEALRPLKQRTTAKDAETRAEVRRILDAARGSPPSQT